MDNVESKTISDVQFTGTFFEFSEENNDTADARVRLSSAVAGDTVVLGKFKQCAERNCKKTPLEWIVLNRIGDRLLLLSKYVLQGKSFNVLNSADESGQIKDANDPDYDPEAVTWKKCSIRNWLDTEFMSAKYFDSVFSAGEKRLVEKVIVRNNGNAIHKTGGCGPTEDFVFLLSSDEIKKFIPVKEERIATVTAYARKMGTSCNNDLRCSWWTRTPGVNAHGTVVVDVYGNINNSYSNNFEFVGVRPALWVNLAL